MLYSSLVVTWGRKVRDINGGTQNIGNKNEPECQDRGKFSCFRHHIKITFMKTKFQRKNGGLVSGWASLIPQLVKNPPVMQETLVRFLGWKDLLEK